MDRFSNGWEHSYILTTWVLIFKKSGFQMFPEFEWSNFRSPLYTDPDCIYFLVSDYWPKRTKSSTNWPSLFHRTIFFSKIGIDSRRCKWRHRWRHCRFRLNFCRVIVARLISDTIPISVCRNNGSQSCRTVITLIHFKNFCRSIYRWYLGPYQLLWTLTSGENRVKLFTP